MSKKVPWGIAACLCLSPLAVLGQNQPIQSSYIYATYFECDPATEARADEIVARTYAPHYNAAVEHGDITGWSWLAHYIGGRWRRALVLNAANMDNLLDASGALGEVIAESTPEAGRAFSDTCSAHEDYIWQTMDGLSSAGDTGIGAAARFSMYIQCDMSREERADELFREQIAPIYTRHVRDGELMGWAMLEHNVGGQYRRLLTMGAEDHKALMRARAAIIEEASSGRAERALRQINEICSQHQDYIWDVQVQNP